MKILLLITTCSLNKERIVNQIKNLKKHEQTLKQLNIIPKFVTSDTDLFAEQYEVIKLNNFEEKYTNLAKKTINLLKYIVANEEFDYAIKMDDDTLFNPDCLDFSYFNSDYTGNFFETFAKNEIIVNLPAYGINNESIRLYPFDYLNNPFIFAGGNFYILSKKATQIAISDTSTIDKFYSEYVHVSEDQLLGYLLRNSDITRQDIGYRTTEIQIKRLQLTKNLVSLHPVPTSLYASLLTKPPAEQLKMLLNSTILDYGRKKLTEKIKNTVKETIYELLNQKRTSGMG